MSKYWEETLEDGSTLKLHPYEAAVLVAAQSTTDPDAPIRGYAAALRSQSVKVGLHRISAAGYVRDKVRGALLVRILRADQAVPGPKQQWFIPYSAFGSVDEMQEAATLIE